MTTHLSPVVAAACTALVLSSAPAAGAVQPASSAAATATARPRITEQPRSVRTHAGSTVRFAVTASGSRLHYQWYAAPPRHAFRAMRHRTRRTLSFVATRKQSGTRYRVVVSNRSGRTTSNAARLTVTARPTTVHGEVWLWDGTKAAGYAPYISLSFHSEPCGLNCDPIVAYADNTGWYQTNLPAGSYYNASGCELDLAIDPNMDFGCWPVGHVNTGPDDFWVSRSTARRIDFVICPVAQSDTPDCTQFRPPS